MSEIKSIRVGDQTFDLRLDFFVCPKHGIFVPSRFGDEDWTTDEGCPVFVDIDYEERCREALTPIYLDSLAEAALDRLLGDEAVEAAAKAAWESSGLPWEKVSPGTFKDGLLAQQRAALEAALNAATNQEETNDGE